MITALVDAAAVRFGKCCGATVQVAVGQACAGAFAAPIGFENQALPRGGSKHVGEVVLTGRTGGTAGVAELGSTVLTKQEVKLFGTGTSPPQEEE